MNASPFAIAHGRKKIAVALLLALGHPVTQSVARSSADYTILAESLEGGGVESVSASYATVGGAGGVSGAVVTSPTYSGGGGQTGQQPSVVGLTLAAAPSTLLDEGATLQLSASQLFDDATTFPLQASLVTWNVLGGPVASIGAGGVATAAAVYRDTGAGVQASYLGQTGALAITVRNVNPDDFGTYSGDALDDGWQVQYFGLDNPLAAPGADASGTGQTNHFKFIAGLHPLDVNSRFTLAIQSVPGQPARKEIIFSPRFADRSYTITFKTDLLAPAWIPLTGSTFSDAGAARTVTDPAAGTGSKYYRLEITKP